MRLDWFLPAIRRPRAQRPARQRYWIVRIARQWLPKSFSSNWTTKRRGLVRTVLGRLGLSWLASPVRRAVQSLSFVLFLFLFFHVCWPYAARPVRYWSGWAPIAVDPATAIASITREQSLEEPPLAGVTLYVSEASADGETLLVFGRFHVVRSDANSTDLSPAQPLSEEVRASMALSPGPWNLSDRAARTWPAHFADNLARKEWLAAESFLIIDPLVSLSTALASRAWVWSLASAGVILIACLLVPRGFCGCLCPLGTLIDLFDTLIGRRVKRFRVSDDGWWVHLKYYLLLGIMVAALCGVLLSGFFAAIPVITRGLLFTLAPLQTGWSNGWHQMPPWNVGHWISILLFAAVLGLGFLKPRFRCKYVCPSGAVFSLGNLFRISERKVESSYIHCNKCVEICPFDAIKADFTTRVSDCTLCQSCAGVCPTGAIRALPLEEKRSTRIGLAFVDEVTCLPMAGREACQLCVDECHSAGYDAIEFTRAGTEADASGQPLEGTGFLAPVVLGDKCVGPECISLFARPVIDRAAIWQ